MAELTHENVRCSECTRLVSPANLRAYEGEEICVRCYENHFRTCTVCGGQYDRTEDWDAWGGMCSGCAEDHFICSTCGNTHHNDDYGGDGICSACYRVDGLHNYHDGAHCGLQFQPKERETVYFGLELETDKYPNGRGDTVIALSAISKSEHLFWLEDDSTLDNGIEIITQPCTLDFHRDKFPWNDLTKLVVKHGGQSHQTTTCGLHIHFSKMVFGMTKPDLYQLRLVYLFEKFWEELVVFSRRNIDDLESWARKYNTDTFDKPARSKMRDLRDGYYNHYQCVNLGNRHTIEIRLFRGTLRVTTILASIELVDFLIKLVKKTSNKKLQLMTWNELVEQISPKEYKYLRDYLTAQELITSSRPPCEPPKKKKKEDEDRRYRPNRYQPTMMPSIRELLADNERPE